MSQAYCSCPIPQLYFPSFDQQVKILKLQKDINEVFSYIVSITQTVEDQLGIPPQIFFPNQHTFKSTGNQQSSSMGED
ncbi:unnamed protein product [Adineta ricciae]|uniref:Uncharacterized protein n=1 Tax=Adineta ricciae TaxID=249248 RepID=A0A814U0D4_ADIRI|nr:unnamed protein product [Adineta ricciae]CAF1462974.1 unnamed protein product [Adineta ricciae]